MLNEIDNKIKKRRKILIIYSIAAVAAIPGIAVGATNMWLWLMIPSIIILLSGFYVLPIAWMFLAMLRKTRNIMRSIIEDEITDISILSAAYGRKFFVKRQLAYMMRKGYLKGYHFSADGNRLEKVEKKVQRTTYKCQDCGANFENETGICQYCGGKYKV